MSSSERPPAPAAPEREQMKKTFGGVRIEVARDEDGSNGRFILEDIDLADEEVQAMGITSNAISLEGLGADKDVAFFTYASLLAMTGFDAANVYCLVRDLIEKEQRALKKGEPGGLIRPRGIVDTSSILKFFRHGQSAPNDPEQERPMTIERAIELLGRENVHGPEDVEFLYGAGFVDFSIVPPIPYTESDLAESKEIFEQTGIQEMLVLFTADKDGKPLTGKRMNELIQKKYDEMGLGTFLFEGNNWFKDEAFYRVLGTTYEWKLITKQVIPNSKGKRHGWQPGDRWTPAETQEDAILKYADAIRIPREQLHRPQSFEMLDAVALHLTATEKLKGKGNGERLLQFEYHGSDEVSSHGNFVSVGNSPGRPGPIAYNGTTRDGYLPFLGTCITRSPSRDSSVLGSLTFEHH